MQSVSITTNVVNSNPAQARCIRYNNITLCDKVVSDLQQVGDFLRVLQFPLPNVLSNIQYRNKSDSHVHMDLLVCRLWTCYICDTNNST
jgi:hypothetical protein